MTVFERAERAGGAFRYAGKAPLFQDVVANQESFDRYMRQLDGGVCAARASTIRYGVDVTHWPELLQPFDRIVIATGAAYRFGLGPVATALLDRGAGRWPLRQAGPVVSRRSATGSTTGRRTPTGAALPRPGRVPARRWS